jgi:hypothetical protein
MDIASMSVCVSGGSNPAIKIPTATWIQKSKMTVRTLLFS